MCTLFFYSSQHQHQHHSSSKIQHIHYYIINHSRAVVPLPPALYSPVYSLERVLSETRLLWSDY